MDKVETMAYAETNGMPWHGLGVPVDDDLSPEEILKKSGCNWIVEKAPIYTMFNGVYEQLRGRYALQRNTDGNVLSIVSDSYQQVQNIEAFDFFTKFTKAGHMKMETAGSLDGGKYIWALAKIDKTFQLPGKDEVIAYLLLMQPHAVGHALISQLTPTRVVCWNTLNFALGKGLKGKGEQVFRMAHLSKFDDAMKAKAEETLGLAQEQFEQFHEAATFLAGVKVANDNVLVEYFDNVVSFDRANAVKDEAGNVKEPRKIEQLREAFDVSPGMKMVSANGTWWGAVNAVTYLADHALGRERDTALRSAWIGSGSNMKRRALNLALDYAKAA